MSNQNDTPKPDPAEQPNPSGLDETICSASSYVESGRHLPEFMRDFHDQKGIFKAIHRTYSGDDPDGKMPDWISAQCYTIDWFLWFMGQRGYTLQKSRAKVSFRPLPNVCQHPTAEAS